MSRIAQGPRFTRVFAFSSVAILLLAASGERALAACNPCSFAYILEVEFVLDGSARSTPLGGADLVFAASLDRDLGLIQELLRAQVSPSAVLTRVKSIILGGTTGTDKNDVLLARDGDVVLWVEAKDGPLARLHASSEAALDRQHAFTYTVTAKGTESPPVTFSFLIAALGNERYPEAVHREESIGIAHFDPDARECRTIEDDVCLDFGCKRTASRLVDLDVGGLIDHDFYDKEDRCAHYKIRVSSTNLFGYDCDLTYKDCEWCGARYQGTVVLDGTCPAQRPWSRKAVGTGTVIGPAGLQDRVNFTITYTEADGRLGSGLPDAGNRFGSISYVAQVQDCHARGMPVDCSVVNLSMQGERLRASTDYSRPVHEVTNGGGSLSVPQGIVSFGTFPFAAPNGDGRYALSVTFEGRTYTDLNDDGTVDVGPFSLWFEGDELWGAFDRSSVPTAVIDSIAPNPALLGEPVHFAGHGVGGSIHRYEWHSHRLAAELDPEARALFTRDDLPSGRHQISFRVHGQHRSPFVYAALTVNQPPVAFINFVENAVDPAHPAVSLKLRDGVPSDPFRFDGGGIDFDGLVVAFEWTYQLATDPPVSLSASPRFELSLPELGTFRIFLRVRDDRGVWSAPATTTVTVRRPPVLLVHGFCGSRRGTWSKLVDDDLLGPEWVGEERDIVVRTFDPDGDFMTNDSPSAVALEVAAEIQRMKARFGVRTVNLVVHSMGGLASRAYIQGAGYRGDVNKLVMLATPNHGASVVDVILLFHGYSEQEVELYIPIPNVSKYLQTVGLVVDVLDFFDLADGLVCLLDDSHAAHDLRPHSRFIRNLNRNFKDEGTEDFGPSGEPNDRIARSTDSTDYFSIRGRGVALSHTHLPAWVKDLIFVATRGAVDLSHMELVWVRSGDLAVTERSLTLDHVAQTDFAHIHTSITDAADSVGKARDYLLDDPPAPPPGEPGLDEIAGAQLLGAGRGSELPGSPQGVEVDAAADRLRVNLVWENVDARTAVKAEEAARPGGIRLQLTSPRGATYDSAAPGGDFKVVRLGTSLTATITNPIPGTWTVRVEGRGTAVVYRWLAHQESGTFLAIGLSTHRTDPGKPVKLAAYAQREGVGVTGATVYAAVAPPTGKPVSLLMVEDPRFPGLYVTDLTPEVEGTYNVLAATSLQGPNGSGPVTRSGFTSFDAESLAELSISTSLSSAQPQQGEPVRWLAQVHNAGTGAAPGIEVQFFDGVPAEGGRLLGTRSVDLPAGPADVQTSILWLATAGTHRLVVVVDPMNRAGEADVTRHVAEIQAVIVDRTAPVARAGADQVAPVGQTVVFDGRASTDEEGIVRYSWQYPAAGAGIDPGGFEFILSGPYVTLPPGFAAPGSYVVELTVTDSAGNVSSDQLTVRVVEELDIGLPVADAGREMSTVVGAAVTFDGTRSQDDFGIARATWDVDVRTDSDGDGHPAADQDLAGLSPTLARGYPRPGLYTARLTVSDAAGNYPSTSDVLVRVGRRAEDCTVTVPPGSDINRALAMAQPGETVCLLPALYPGVISIFTPGVTLDGQGAIVAGAGPIGLGVVVNTTERAEQRGVTVRHLTVRDCGIGFFVVGGAGHHLVDNAAQDCQAGFLVLGEKGVVERNRAERAAQGFISGGVDTRFVDNSARGGNVGFRIGGLRPRLEANQACDNVSADLAVQDVGASQSGVDNACGVAQSWSDEGRRGCTFACGRIRVPTSGLVVDQDTYFDAGTFELTEGIVVTGTNLRVRLAATNLVGPEGVDVPGIEIRDAAGVTLSGGTIAGFQRGLRVQGSDGIQVDGIEITDAEVGVEVADSTQGQLSNSRAIARRYALSLAASVRAWTVDHSELTGEEENSALVAGSGHSLHHNHASGGIAVDRAADSHLVDNIVLSRRNGISVTSSEAVEVRGNDVSGGATGILVRDSRMSRILDNAVSGHRGILLVGGAEHRVAGNRVETLAEAIYLNRTVNSDVVGNRLAAHDGAGIQLELSNGNDIVSNDVSSSPRGIELNSSDSNRLHGNHAVSSRLLPSIALTGARGNEIAGNRLTDLWAGGVLALGSRDNRIGGNELRTSGAAAREIVATGIGLVEHLRDSPGIPAGDLAKGLSLAWESLRSFSGLERLNPRTGARFFHRLAAALRVFQRLAAEPQALRRERDLLGLATAQMARGAELVAQSAIREAREAGADPALLEKAQRDLQQGIASAQAGRHSRAADAFGSAWSAIRAAAYSPARLFSTMTVKGRFAERGEVTYFVTLSNAGPQTQRDNAGDELFDRLPASLQLTGVAASAGQVREDRALGTVAWNGPIPPGGSVSLTISATIRPGTAGQTIANQGSVFFDADGDGLNTASAPTDDPTLPGSTDATVFTVAAQEPGPAEIPTLSPVALLMLISLLAVAAIVAFRWKRPVQRSR